ncbi:MAG: futalosine hydrolase [Sphingobacterium sp.]
MKTLIVAATEAEIAPSIPLLVSQNMDFLITGVGMVATAFKMGQFLSDKSYDLLLNVGIAGTFDNQHPLGSLFRVKSDRIFLLGAENGPHFLPIDQLGFGSSIFHEQLPRPPVAKAIQDLVDIDAITVNTVHGEASSIARVTKAHGPQLLESMEGAAFFYTAQNLATPCVQVRSVSNLIEQRNPDNWDIELAITQLNNWLHIYIKSMT